MNSDYEIKVIIDESCERPIIEVHTKSNSNEINDLVKKLQNMKNSRNNYITVYKDRKIIQIEKNDIIHFKKQDKQVVLETRDNSYILKKTIIQLEEELDNNLFVKISQSEIINTKMVKNIDLSVVGTMIIELENDIKSKVSRRYIKSVREFFVN